MVQAVGQGQAVVQLLCAALAGAVHRCPQQRHQIGRHDLAHGLAKEFFGRAVQPLARARLEEHKALLVVDQEEHVLHHAEHLLQDGAALQGGGLGLAQIGDIQARADVADEAVVGVVAGLAL